LESYPADRRAAPQDVFDYYSLLRFAARWQECRQIEQRGGIAAHTLYKCKELINLSVFDSLVEADAAS